MARKAFGRRQGHAVGAVAARQAGGDYRSPNNICEACGCFRSAHHSGGGPVINGAPCKLHADCPGMAFRPDQPTRQGRRFLTDDEAVRAKAMLEAGATYVEVARKLHWLDGDNALRHRFPEYNNLNAPVKAELGELSDRLKRLGLG